MHNLHAFGGENLQSNQHTGISARRVTCCLFLLVLKAERKLTLSEPKRWKYRQERRNSIEKFTYQQLIRPVLGQPVLQFAKRLEADLLRISSLVK